MNILFELVAILSKEEVKNFKLISKRTLSEKNRKDLRLFDMIRQKGDGYTEEKALDKLTEDGQTRNSFFRLKSKLLNDINKSLFFLHADNDPFSKISLCLSNARIFFNRNNYELAAYYLKKGEKIAEKNELLDLLDVIYREKLKVSQHVFDIDPANLIERRKENYKKLEKLTRMDEIISTLKYRLHHSYNYSSHPPEMQELINETIQSYSSDPDLLGSLKMRIRIFQIVSNLAIQNHDFNGLLNYTKTTYNEFEKNDLFNKFTHDIKLQMLSYIINSCSALGLNEEIIYYIGILEDQMKAYNNFLRNKYLLFYYNSMVLYYFSIKDYDGAIAFLNEIRTQKIVKEWPYYPIFVHYHLALLFFHKKRFAESVREFNKVYHHPKYGGINDDFKFKIRINELIVRLELEELEYVEYQINRVCKDFPGHLNNPQFHKEVEFIEVLRRLSGNLFWKDDKETKGSVKAFLQKYPSSDNSREENIPYSFWLEGKIG